MKTLLILILSATSYAQTVTWVKRYTKPGGDTPNSPSWIWWGNAVNDRVANRTVFQLAPWATSSIFSTGTFFWNSTAHTWLDWGNTGSATDACPASFVIPRDRHINSNSAVDTVRNRFWLGGGVNVNCADNPLLDLYYMDFKSDPTTNTWVRVIPAHFTNSSGYAAWFYDTDDDVLVLFGGQGGGFAQQWVFCYTNGGALSAAQTTAGCSSADDWINITSLISGFPTGNTSPPVTYLNMVYDSVTHKGILYGGANSSANVYSNQTWLYNVPTKTWTQACTGGCSPPPIYNGLLGDIGALAYHFGDHKVYYQQGRNTGSPAFWVYDPVGDTWTKLTSTGLGSPAYNEGILAVDSAANKLIWWVVNPDTTLPELWEGSLPSVAAAATKFIISQ